MSYMYGETWYFSYTIVPPTIEVNPPRIDRMGRQKIISVGTGTQTVNIQLFNETLVSEMII